jgi:hypothetical protein
MSWNHRVLAFEHKGNVYFQIHEVYYNENGVPNSYAENAVSISVEEFDELEWTLDRMKECLKKDVLWGDERFPQKCEITYTCTLCGRDKFIKKQRHQCKGGFRKRGLTWEVNYK